MKKEKSINKKLTSKDYSHMWGESVPFVWPTSVRPYVRVELAMDKLMTGQNTI